jgi:acyl carrier protein
MSTETVVSEIRSILKQSKRVTNQKLLECAKLAIKEVLQERVDVDKITEEASLMEDLGADSLDLVELIMFLEECFGVEKNKTKKRKPLTSVPQSKPGLTFPSASASIQERSELAAITNEKIQNALNEAISDDDTTTS